MRADFTEALTVYNCLLLFMQQYEEETWTGTASQLLEELRLHLVNVPHGRLPSNGQSLSVLIFRYVGQVGPTHLLITQKRRDKKGTRYINIHKEQGFYEHEPFLIRF